MINILAPGHGIVDHEVVDVNDNLARLTKEKDANEKERRNCKLAILIPNVRMSLKHKNYAKRQKL